MNIFKSKSSLEENAVLPEFNNYKMLDIVKYVVAIMVVCIHCNQQGSQDFLAFFIQNIVCRIAVPFFFIASAYFVRKGSAENSGYVTGYLKKTIKSYLLWSLIFVPVGLDWVYQNLELAGALLPLALIYGLIHIGTYYHLWYIPAMAFSIFAVNKLLKYISYKLLFVISILLYMFGSIETYYGLLPAGLFKDFFDMLIKVIFTTRSGLFYGVIFVLIGFFIYDYQEKLKAIIKYVPALTILSAVLLIIEGVSLYNIVRLDMNFLIGLIPFSFFFFLWVLTFPYKPKCDTKKVRELSKYYYFIHPVCIVIIEQIGFAYGIGFLSSGLLSFVLVVILTHLLSSYIIDMKPLKNSRILFSALYGLIITFILSSVIFLFKSADIMINFEVVPCIWLVFSVIVCYLLSKKSKKPLERNG